MSHRIEDIEFGPLLYTIQQAFEEYTSAVGRPDDLEIEGIYVVGSSLTEEFKSGESDLDFYVKLSQPYDKSDGFRRLLSDPDEYWAQEVASCLPDSFDDVDMLGCVTGESTIRTPNKYIPS